MLSDGRMVPHPLPKRGGTRMLRLGLALTLFTLGIPPNVQAQSSEVYTCVDARGRKLTADRPIPECTDREQRVLNPSGTLKTIVGPTLTQQERVRQEAKDKQEAEVRNRQKEEHRRDQALLVRYPDQATHDKERKEALGKVADVVAAAKVRLRDLESQRVKIQSELEFYKKEPNRAPEYLRHQLDDNLQNASAQQQFLQEQDEEVRRINARFDDELSRLQKLWGPGNSR